MKMIKKTIRFWLVTWFIYNSSIFAVGIVYIGQASLLEYCKWFAEIYFLYWIVDAMLDPCGPVGQHLLEPCTSRSAMAGSIGGALICMTAIAIWPFFLWYVKPFALTAFILAFIGLVTSPIVYIWMSLPPEYWLWVPLVLGMEYALFYHFNWWRRKYRPEWKIPFIDEPLI